MNLKCLCPKWGSENISWKDFFPKAKNEGYDGVEFGVPRDLHQVTLDEIWNLSVKHDMLLIPQHYDTYEGSYSEHYDLYCKWLEKMKPYNSFKINSQTGKDFFTFEQNHSLILAAERFAEANGVEIYHETHRNKFSFAAHVTKEYLEKIPSLKITLDISHWVCVSESFLEDQPEAVIIALERTAHFHARVGYAEGPQVPDPRAAEWQSALEAHLGWWDKVAELMKSKNEILTFTPEFGPFPYMVPLPTTNEPIADQWEVNQFMMRLLKERYS
ncbi:MAG: sugar phosphate isomerase/epimerase [Ginsengibacter sp.]